MNSLCPTSQSDLTGAMCRGRMPFHRLEAPQSNLPERSPEVAARHLFGRTYDLSKGLLVILFARFTLSKPMLKYLL